MLDRHEMCKSEPTQTPRRKSATNGAAESFWQGWTGSPPCQEWWFCGYEHVKPYQIVYFRYVPFITANYTSIKLLWERPALGPTLLIWKGFANHIYSSKHAYSLQRPGLGVLPLRSTHCSKGKFSDPQSPCSPILCSQLTGANIKTPCSVYIVTTVLLYVHLQHYSERPCSPGRTCLPPFLFPLPIPPTFISVWPPVREEGMKGDEGALSLTLVAQKSHLSLDVSAGML